MSHDTSLQPELAEAWRPPRRRVIVPMGLAVLCAGLVVRLPHCATERLDLEPYLTRKVPETLLSEATLAALSSTSWMAALIAGLCGVLFFVVVEGLIRRFWLHANEAPAMLVAMGFVALPALAGALRVEGNQTLLPALAFVLAGCRLGLAQQPGWSLLGMLLAIGASAIHPGAILLLPAVVACATVGGHLPGLIRPFAALAGAAAIAAGILWLQGSEWVAPLAEGAQARRLEFLGRALVSLPGMLVDASPRAVLPTGHAALTGAWPLGAWPFVSVMLLAFVFMVVGIVRGFATLAVTLSAAAVGPFLVPGWIPGDAGVLVLAGLPLLAMVGALLGAFRTWPLPMVMVGIALGGAVVAMVHENGREGFLRTRAVALDLPRRVTPTGQILDVDFSRERDPARLILYSRDVLRSDPHWKPARDAFLVRRHEKEPALDGLRLKDLYDSPVLTPTKVNPDARDLLARLATVENKLGLLEDRWSRSRKREPFVELVRDVEVLGPEVLDYHFSMPAHYRSVALVRRFKKLASDVTHVASRVGWPALSRPLREMVVEICQANEKAHESAILGRDLLDMGEPDAAIAVLKEAVGSLRRRSVIGAVSRGALGRALAATGKEREGLDEINRGWSGLAQTSAAGGSRQSVLRLASPASLEYYLIAELLLARHELTKRLDPGLQAQTLKDVEAMLDPVLARGRRRAAALALKGRLLAQEGERLEAQRRLEEMWRIETPTLEETADGPTGRINLPTFRLPALRLLRELLDAEKRAADIEAIDAEIERLDAEVRLGAIS